MAQSDQLRVPEPAKADPKSFELLRVWVAQQDQHISLRVGVWDDPADWGVMLADLARHIANAFEKVEHRDPVEVLEKIRAGFETGIESSCDDTVHGEVSG